MSYVQWAGDFSAALQSGVDPYHAQRLLPSAIVYGALASLGISRIGVPVIIAFQILDALALVGAAVAWTGIARTLSWSRAAAWAGFAAVFASFAIARTRCTTRRSPTRPRSPSARR
jgi:hypothetical protein